MSSKQSFDVEALKKHHFWIVCVVAGLIVPLLCWYMATGSLADSYAKNKKKREAVRRQIVGFAANQQPNAKINSFLDARHGQLRDRVFEAWKKRYEEQKHVDQWPPIFQPEHLKEIVEKIRNDEQIPEYLRVMYASNVRGEFAKLYDIIGLRKPIEHKKDGKRRPGADAAPGDFREGGGKFQNFQPGQLGQPRQDAGGLDGGRVGGEGVEYAGLVAWSDSERNFLEMKYGMGWTVAPSTEGMLFTQESINVYRVMLQDVIKKTNGDADDHQKLVIKMIKTFRIGEDCEPPRAGGVGGAPGPGGAAGGVGPPPGGQAGEVPPGAIPGAPGGAFGDVGEGRNQGGPAGGNAQGGADGDQFTPFRFGPLAGAGGNPGGNRFGGNDGANRQTTTVSPPSGRFRFVDDNSFAVGDPAKQPYAEFRMLPVAFVVVMDHRHIPAMVTNCADSSLPLAVRQMNVRALESSGGDRKDGEQLPGRGGAGGFNIPGQIGGDGGEKRNQKQLTFGQEFERGPYDMEVEVRGVIYIFNPPNPKKVGQGEAAAAAQQAAAGEAGETGPPAENGGPDAPPDGGPPPAKGDA